MTSLRRRTLVALLAACAVFGLASCGDDTPDGYDASSRSAMLGGCAEDDTDPDVVDVCTCVYDRMEEDVAFERFAALENRLAGGDARLPDDVVDIIRGCIRSVAATRT